MLIIRYLLLSITDQWQNNPRFSVMTLEYLTVISRNCYFYEE